MSPGGPRVVGRASELAKLDRLVTEVTHGRGAICLIHGEPGIGKSTVADAAAASARDAGMTVFRADGDPLMTGFPLRLMAECIGITTKPLDDARAEIAGLLRGDVAAHKGTIDPVLAASERILEFADRLATAGPIALILEDLQFADEPSLLVWNRLIRMVDQLPLLLIGTFRPVPMRESLQRLHAAAQEHGGLVIDLSPLTTEAVVAMAAELTAAQPGPRLRHELSRAGGNPLYVREMVNALLLDHLVEVSGDIAELRSAATTATTATTPATPATLTAAIGRRLSFVSGQTLPTLRIAALLGKTFSGTELATATGHVAARLGLAVSEAVTAGVLVERGNRLRFRHDLIREALRAQIPETLRETLHGEIARSLATAGAEIDMIATHLLATSDSLDAWAIEWLTRLNAQSLLSSADPAVELLTRALRVLAAEDPRHELLTAHLIHVLYWTGRNQQLNEVAGASLRRFGDLELAARCRIQWARSCTKTGRFSAAFNALESLRHDERVSAPMRARMQAWAASAVIRSGRPGEGRPMADAALALARSTGDPVSVATALSVVQQVCDHPTQLRLIDEALSVLVGDDPDTVELQIILNSLKSYPLAYLGRKEEAQDSLRHAALMAERSGSWRKVDISTIASEHAFEQGNWDDALVTIGSIPREHLEGPSYCYLLGLAARVALHRENRELAIKHLMAAGISDFTKPTSRGRGNGMYLSHAMAMLAQLDGDQRLALNIMRSWLAVDSHNRLYRHYESMTLMRLALACGDRVTAEATADAAGVVAETGTFFVANACARTCAAMLAGDPVELLAIAERHARDGWPEFAAINFEEAATRLAEGNDLQKARTVYTEAVRIYAALGATWDIRRADANMRPYGIRRGSRSLHRREKTGWNALTPTETRIAGLLAQGRSNPDISAELYVSRSTVQTHVSNILGKLQLRSRVELIREVSGRQNG